MRFGRIQYSSDILIFSILYFSYECLDSTKLVTYAKNKTFLESKVTVECLYNGQWSYDIEHLNCTQCEKPTDPPNGKFVCQSFFFEEQSTCSLVIFMTLCILEWIQIVSKNYFDSFLLLNDTERVVVSRSKHDMKGSCYHIYWYL